MPPTSGISQGHHITVSSVSDAPMVVLPAHFLAPIPHLLLLRPTTSRSQSPVSPLLSLSCILVSGFIFRSEGQEQVGPLVLHSTNMTCHDPHDHDLCLQCVCYLAMALLQG